MILEHPWERVENILLGSHRTYRRGTMTVIIEDPDTLTPFDWHISVSMEGRPPMDAEAAAVLGQLGVKLADALEMPSVVNPCARHFFGRR